MPQMNGNRLYFREPIGLNSYTMNLFALVLWFDRNSHNYYAERRIFT
jgi:hypothetical protein